MASHEVLLAFVQAATQGSFSAAARKLVGDTTADTLRIERPTLIQQVRLDAILDAWALSARLATGLNADRSVRIASEELHRAIMEKMGGMAGAPFEIPEEFEKRWFPDTPPRPTPPTT